METEIMAIKGLIKDPGLISKAKAEAEKFIKSSGFKKSKNLIESFIAEKSLETESESNIINKVFDEFFSYVNYVPMSRAATKRSPRYEPNPNDPLDAALATAFAGFMGAFMLGSLARGFSNALADSPTRGILPTMTPYRIQIITIISFGILFVSYVVYNYIKAKQAEETNKLLREQNEELRIIQEKPANNPLALQGPYKSGRPHKPNVRKRSIEIEF